MNQIDVTYLLRHNLSCTNLTVFSKTEVGQSRFDMRQLITVVMDELDDSINVAQQSVVDGMVNDGA